MQAAVQADDATAALACRRLVVAYATEGRGLWGGVGGLGVEGTETPGGSRSSRSRPRDIGDLTTQAEVSRASRSRARFERAPTGTALVASVHESRADGRANCRSADRPTAEP